MPWLAPSEDAPDTHKLWADPGTPYEAALRASGWRVEVPGPLSDILDEAAVLLTEEETPAVEDDQPPVEPVEPAPKRTRRTRRK